jgi:hypothetical protein
VDQLDDHAGVDQLGPGRVAEVAGERDQQRPEALAAGADEVAGGLVDEGVAGGDLLVEPLLDLVEDPGDRQAVRLELGEDRRGDRQARGGPGAGAGPRSPDQRRGAVGELQQQLGLDAEVDHQRRADRDARGQPVVTTGSGAVERAPRGTSSPAMRR